MALTLAFLKPLGVWGVCALAIVDSSSIPMPIDAIVIGYVAADHARFVIYAFMAALGSAIGSLVPYYLAIMIPAMMPPPMPVKLFELAAGVFEMKPIWFFTAIFTGKFLRFILWAAITVFYGPAIVHTVSHTFHQHLGIVLAVLGVLAVLLGVYITRKIFDRRATPLPIEENPNS